MQFVKALVEGVWTDCARTSGGRSQRRFLARALVDGTWCLDHAPVDVERGLVVSAASEDDLKHFLFADRKTMPRAEPVSVVPGMIVAFADEGDAQHFIASGEAEPMSEAEVYAAINAPSGADGHASSAVGADDDHQTSEGDEAMLKQTDIENKGGVKPTETKAPPKPKASKGKK